MTLGKRLREARLAKKLTQTQIGKIAGVSKQAIAKIESDKTRDPATSTLEPIARRLGIDLRTLIGGNGAKPPQEAQMNESTPDAAYLANALLELSAAVTETIPALGKAWRSRLEDMEVPAGAHVEIHEALLIALEASPDKRKAPHLSSARASSGPPRRKA